MQKKWSFQPLECNLNKIDYFRGNRLVFVVANAGIQDKSVSSGINENEDEETQIDNLAIEIQKQHGGSLELAKRTAHAEYNLSLQDRVIIRLTLAAKTDSLTGLNNRRQFDILFEKEIARANRHEETLSLLMLDIDFFKLVNDLLGHQVGDAAIKILTDLIKEVIRTEDIAARYGGEEFVIILPSTEDASILAERLRAHIESEFKSRLLDVIRNDHPALYKKIINKTIEGRKKEYYGKDFKDYVYGTASIGVATIKGKNEVSGAPTGKELLEKADLALYRSKAGGRNRVTLYEKKVEEVKKEEERLTSEQEKAILEEKLGKLFSHLDELQKELELWNKMIKKHSEEEEIMLIDKNITNTRVEISKTNEEIKTINYELETLEKERKPEEAETAVA